jgi:hypothetical protein
MDAVSLTTALTVYGPLGILSAAGIWWKLQSDKRIDAINKAAMEREQLRDAEIQKLVSAHQTEVREMTNRFLALVETYAGHYRGLLDRVGAVLEALPKAVKR